MCPGIALLGLPLSLICSVLIHLSSCQSCSLSPSSCTTTHSSRSSLAPLSLAPSALSIERSFRATSYLSIPLLHPSISLIFLNLPAQSKVRISFWLSLISLSHLPSSPTSSFVLAPSPLPFPDHPHQLLFLNPPSCSVRPCVPHTLLRHQRSFCSFPSLISPSAALGFLFF